MLELVITMIVVTVLILIAVPTFDYWQAKQRMNAALHALHQDLLAARSQAILLGTHVVACPGNFANGCRDDSDWSRGWLVFQDIDANRQYGPTESLIRNSRATERVNIMSSAHRNSFRFYANGTAPGSNGSIWFCGARGPQHAQRIVVSNVGRIRREHFDGLELEDCPD
jgi:type IV fimbrial biogenesis protein FimT